MSNSNWCTIESDPGVFTELIEKLGVNGIQMQEIYSLDDAEFMQLPKVYGLIFLFKWRVTDYSTDERKTLTFSESANVFFAKQIVHNACATQALLSILMNIHDPDVDVGEKLNGFKNFTEEMAPDLKGICIGDNENIRVTHNSFARPEPFASEKKKSTASDDDDDVFHFISYVPIGESAYELDGLKSGPIMLGEYESNNWLSVVRPAIQERINNFNSGEVHFNLMAMVKSPRVIAENEVTRLEAQLEQYNQQLIACEETDLPASISNKIIELNGLIAAQNNIIEAEEAKMNNWKEENIRRKHNYIPFIVKLLEMLATKGELSPLIEAAQEKATQRTVNASKNKIDPTVGNDK